MKEDMHYIALIKTAWKFADNKRWRLPLIYILFFVANTIALLEPLIFAAIINTIQIGGDEMLKTLAFWLLAIVALETTFWLFHGPARIIEREFAFDVAKSYRQKLFAGLGRLHLKWHHDHHSGDTISRAKKATDSLFEFTQHQFEYIQAVYKFIFINCIFFWFVPKYAFFALLASLLLFVVIYKFDRYYAIFLKKCNEKEHHMDAGFIDFIGNAVTILTLRVQRMAEKEYFKRIKRLLKPFKIKIRLNEWKWFIASVGVAFIYFIVLFPYAYEQFYLGEAVLVGGFVALMDYVRRYSSIFHNFAYKYEELVKNHTNVKALDSVWEGIERSKPLSSKLDKKPWSVVKISNLYFQHEPDTKAHDLHNVSFEVKKGGKIALIGESGSGKSTLMRVMRGLYKPNDITVAFDGKESAEAYRWLQNHTTLIPQDPEIFESTIEFNITLGVSVSKTEFDKVIKLARFDKVLKRLPKKEKTDIRERGVNLSGGEKQRLALARGLLAAKQSDIVLLDEPTSSVDIENELAIFKSLFSEWKDKCVIASVHRLHLLDQFDEVYEMANGATKKAKRKL